MQATEKDRRTQILDAALSCFLERGYLATSIADIRKASGASTGSIYHFFANKGALARALLDQAVAGWSGAASSALDAEAPAEKAIKASVSGLVTWGLANPALLRFMDEMRTLGDNDPDFAVVREAFDQGRALGAAQYRRYEKRAEVRPLPFPLAHSLMLGPAYNYLRLVGGGEKPNPKAAGLLADAAWASVKA
jgi:AcrR family transcriptional regulator